MSSLGRTLFIAGKNKYPDIIWKTLSIERNLTYIMDTCQFQVRYYQPLEGEEVIIEDDVAGRLFAGIVTKVELARSFPTNQVVGVWQVGCNDYTELIDQKLVVEAYENMSASDIFMDLAIKYCPDFTTEGVRPNAPIVESTGVEFEYKRPSECFKWLCDYCGWHWRPGYFKDLHFFSADELPSPAPMILQPGGEFRFGRHSIDRHGLRNRVYVRGGAMLSDPQQVKWKADGEGRIWVLPWPPHEVSLSVGEVPQTVGVENLHDEGHFDYMMSFSEKYIRCSAYTSTPIAGITMALTARQDIPVLTMVEDYQSQQAVAEIQKGDGVYEHIVEDDSLITIAAAEAAGMADLREHANPRVKGDFETEYVMSENFEYYDITSPWQIEQLEDDYLRYYFYSGQSVGQSFETVLGMDGASILQVSVMSGGELIFPIPTRWHIYNDKDGFPGTSISQNGYAEVDAGDWPANPGEWLTTEIVLDTPLHRGRTYWLVIQAYGTDYYIYYVKYQTGWDKYSKGCMARKSNGKWEKYPNVDLTFRIKALQLKVFETDPWTPGQIVRIDLPRQGVVGEYLVQRVSIMPASPKLWTHHIEYGGRLLGIADFLQALVSSQQKKRYLEPAQNIQKYVYGEETLLLSDQLLIIPRELPYICGDPDAICGEVLVSNG